MGRSPHKVTVTDHRGMIKGIYANEQLIPPKKEYESGKDQ